MVCARNHKWTWPRHRAHNWEFTWIHREKRKNKKRVREAEHYVEHFALLLLLSSSSSLIPLFASAARHFFPFHQINNIPGYCSKTYRFFGVSYSLFSCWDFLFLVHFILVSTAIHLFFIISVVFFLCVSNIHMFMPVHEVQVVFCSMLNNRISSILPYTLFFRSFSLSPYLFRFRTQWIFKSLSNLNLSLLNAWIYRLTWSQRSVYVVALYINITKCI